MDTTFRSPSPTGIWIGSILPTSGDPPRRPSIPSILGTENPQMSASMTPTVKPRDASDAARFTVTEDLPTPPFPDATMRTRVSTGISVSGAFWLTLNRAFAIAAAFSSWFISAQVRCTPVTPGRPPTRERTSRWICARRGQPEVVSAMVTSTLPSGSTRTARAIPSSTMSVPSSGSITARRIPNTSSTVGSAGSAMGSSYGAGAGIRKLWSLDSAVRAWSPESVAWSPESVGGSDDHLDR